jgi:GTPase SAR1 family protein
VTTIDAKKLKSKINAYSLVECSAKNKTNLSTVFEEAIRAVERKPKHSRKPCTIL